VRVVILTHNYPRWPGDLSGAPLGALARALLRRGISVRVVAPSADAPGISELDGVPVRRVPFRGGAPGRGSLDQDPANPVLQTPMGWNGLLRLWRALSSAARREVAAGADLIHAHWWIPSGLASPREIPTVVTVHGPDASLLRRSRLARWLARPVLSRSAVVTAVSRPIGELVQNVAGRLMGPEQVHPMPIDSKGYPWTRAGGGAVVAARLVAHARVELAIETVAVLASCGHYLPLTIIGDGPDRGALEQCASRLGIAELLHFAGDLSPEQTRGCLARADLMLFTASEEAAALPVLEALIAGVPVIACWDSGAAVDIVPASGAGRLSLPQPETLADHVLDLQADPDRLAMSRLVGEAWRARLAPDHVAELCEGWYRGALTR
jgi:glycosyltransferase involved in cell wall biosynthesis